MTSETLIIWKDLDGVWKVSSDPATQRQTKAGVRGFVVSVGSAPVVDGGLLVDSGVRVCDAYLIIGNGRLQIRGE